MTHYCTSGAHDGRQQQSADALRQCRQRKDDEEQNISDPVAILIDKYLTVFDPVAEWQEAQFFNNYETRFRL